MKEKLIKLLKQGYSQKEISAIFKEQGIKPNSVSIVEKEIKKLKKEYNAKTYFHLGYLISKSEQRRINIKTPYQDR